MGFLPIAAVIWVGLHLAISGTLLRDVLDRPCVESAAFLFGRHLDVPNIIRWHQFFIDRPSTHSGKVFAAIVRSSRLLCLAVAQHLDVSRAEL